MSGPVGRERLMAVAEELFAARGYQGTSVRDIVKAAGVTQPSLYHFFGSKQQLVVELMQDRYHRYCDGLDAALASRTDARAVLERHVEYVVAGMRDAPVTARFVFSTMFGPQHGLPVASLRPLLARARSILPVHLRRTAPGVAAERVDFVAGALQGMVTPVVLHFLTVGEARPPAGMAAVLAARAEAMLRDGDAVFVWPAL